MSNKEFVQVFGLLFSFVGKRVADNLQTHIAAYKFDADASILVGIEKKNDNVQKAVHAASDKEVEIFFRLCNEDDLIER